MSHNERPVPLRRTPPLYADVIVPRHIAKAFTYLVPAALMPTLAIGHRVLVPFGRATVEGAVIALRDHPPTGVKPSYLKEIRSRTDGPGNTEITSTLFELTRTIAERYVAPWGQCLRLVFPPTPTRNTSPLRRVRTSADQCDRGKYTGRLPDADELPETDPLWVARVAEALRAGQAQRIVLHAPWEHRVRRLTDAIQQAHEMNKSSIILSGQAARAEWLGQLLSTITKLPITFSPTASRPDRWEQVQDGTPSIVVGTRSAIFAPLQSLGLIWVDGEDDPAFKEPQEPRYHARDVACMRADIDHALVVLASAHPSLESKLDTGADIYAVLPEIARRPEIELVDLRDEPAGTLFSRRLIDAMREAVERKAGVLLFLNRKGYAGTLVCRDCSWVPRCPSCAVALTYYREAGRLACRYCGAAAALPDSCPTCRASRLSPVGEGTERVEVEARRLFPHAKIARLDGDTLRRSASARSVLEGVTSGAWDILIGTQALFQREPVPRRALVGILHADSGLHVPDFRAAERTYHLLVDAVSLASPASTGGRVILQTRLPTHHAVQAVFWGEPNRFYDEESAARRLLGYPPACRLAVLLVSGKDLRMVETAAQQWRSSIEQAISGQESVMILGPVPAMGGRPKGHHRHRMLVKGADPTLLCRGIRESVERMERAYRKGQIKFVVDVDPVEMG